MSSFVTTAVVRHPLDRVWRVMRDDMQGVARGVGDIRSVTTVSRVDGAESVSLVNVWEAAPLLPPALVRVLSSDAFRWTDRAQWQNATHACRWSIEPAFAPDRIVCNGTTTYEAAIGGRGTRIVFRGDLEIRGGGMLQPVVALIESFVSSVIPRNFQNLAAAAGSYLDRKSVN